jgi:hypothetical protein
VGVRYMKVAWYHDFADEPVWLYSEIVEDRETRRVDVFRDGRLGFADEDREAHGSGLAEVPMPRPEDLDGLAEFSAAAIDRAEFERLWRQALAADQPATGSLAGRDQSARQDGISNGSQK